MHHYLLTLLRPFCRGPSLP